MPAGGLYPIFMLDSAHAVQQFNFLTSQQPGTLRKYHLTRCLQFFEASQLHQGDLVAICINPAGQLMIQCHTPLRPCPVVWSAYRAMLPTAPTLIPPGPRIEQECKPPQVVSQERALVARSAVRYIVPCF